MLFHHKKKPHKIRSKDILSNTKLNDPKTIKFSPEYHLFYFADNSNSVYENCKKIYIIVMHTRCCRGKVSKKFKIFNNKPDWVKSERNNQNNSRIYLRQRLFYFENYSISINTSHKFFPSKYTITSSWGKVSQYTWNRCLSFQKHFVKVYVSILILNIYKTLVGYTPEEVQSLFKGVSPGHSGSLW